MRDEVTYRISPDGRVEAMYARFRTHVYPLHAHETYSFGVTEAGAQAFRCRGEQRVSAAGMVMAFNPDDPHDGHPAARFGYHYRMLHVDSGLVADVLADASGRPTALPLFARPVVSDAGLADAVRRLHVAVAEGDPLAYDENVLRLVAAMVERSASKPLRTRSPSGNVRRVRDFLLDDPARTFRADDLAELAGCSRFALYRAFRAAYGLAPSEFQRQARLRHARRLIRAGGSLADIAVEVGFADQGHLSRWFARTFGITPGAYRKATGLSVASG